jgi:hypothetical protein
LKRLEKLASRKSQFALQKQSEIISAVDADLLLTVWTRMKPGDKTLLPFPLAPADGQVLTFRNNESAGKL